MNPLEATSPLPSVETEPLTRKEVALVKAGATREVAYKSFVEALGAETMSLDKFGDEHFAPDHSTRIRAAEMISKLNGDLKAETVVDNRVVNISGVNAEALGGLVQMVSDVKLQLESLRESGRQTGEILDVQVVT